MPVHRSWTGCFPASQPFGDLGRPAVWRSRRREEHGKPVDNPYLRHFSVWSSGLGWTTLPTLSAVGGRSRFGAFIPQQPCRAFPQIIILGLGRGEWQACFGKRFGGSGSDPEALIRGQSSERPMGPERVEGVDAAVHLHEVLVVDPPQAVEFVPPHPVGALDAPVEIGRFGRQYPEADARASHSASNSTLNSLPPSTWIASISNGISLTTLLGIRVRSSRSRSGMLGSRYTSPRDPRLRRSRASSRTASPERLPRRPSKNGPSERSMPTEQRRKASRDLPSIRIWSTRAHSRRPSSAPRCRPVRRNRRPCR